MLDGRDSVERSPGPAPEVNPARGAQPAMMPIDPAPRVPPADLRNEWRGTLPEALRESAARNGATGFASADWASQSALRVTAPQDLAASVERTHARVAASEPQPSVYTVGSDGTIYNTVTNRAEYVPVREASAAPQVAAAATDLRNDLPRLQEERREPEITRRIEEARTQHQLPDVDGLTYSQRGELYGRMYLEGTDAAGRQAFEAGQRVVFAMRVPTDVRANGGDGIYDDRMVVLQRREDGSTAVLHESKTTTEPAGRYEHKGPVQHGPKIEGMDADGDGTRDLGRVQAGASVELVWDHAAGLGPNLYTVQGQGVNVLRPVPGSRVLVDRDVNHDGRFDAADEALTDGKPTVSEDRSFLIHRGGALQGGGSELPAGHTWSGGCSTMPGGDFAGSFAGALDPRHGQIAFRYTISEM